MDPDVFTFTEYWLIEASVPRNSVPEEDSVRLAVLTKRDVRHEFERLFEAGATNVTVTHRAVA